MDKLFKKLRGAFAENGFNREIISEVLDGRSQTYITNRMTNREPWSLDDAYKLMDEMHIPYEQMHIYFPKNGITYQERRETNVKYSDLQLSKSAR